MTNDDRFDPTPDTGTRHFNEYQLHYGSDSRSIALFRRGWHGQRIQVAQIAFIADSDSERTHIPGDDEDPNSHLRVLELEIHGSRLGDVLAILGLPGSKSVFVNEQSDVWSITVDHGSGPATTT